MPLPADLIIRQPPRYYRHLGKLLVAMVLLILWDTLTLMGQVKQHKRTSTPATAPVEIFEVATRISGEVIVCTSTRDGSGTATGVPIQLGYLYSCDYSRPYVQKFRAGQAGCLAFHDAASVERFMTCFVEDL